MATKSKPSDAKSTTAKAASKPKVTSAKAKNISFEAISKKAYEIYVKSGYQSDRDAQNWAQAEKELKQAK